MHLLRETFGELDELWRSIGLSPKERAEQVETLFIEMNELCKTKIETEKALAISYREEVRKLREDLAICADRLDISWEPKSVPADFSLIRELTVLRGDYEELDRKRSEMEKQMMDKLAQLHHCWDDMRMKYEPGFESIGFKLSARRMNEIDHKYEETRRERDRRAAIVKGRVKEAFELMELLELGAEATSPFDHAIMTNNQAAIGLSLESMEQLEQRVNELQTEKQAREAILMKLGNQIQPLWEKLNISQPERDSFFKRNGTFGHRSIRACEDELTRLKEMRRQKMSAFIDATRSELRAAMDEARLLPTEKARLNRLLTESVDPEDYEACDQLLLRHEHELEKVKVIVEAIKPVVLACQKYMKLCQERLEYEALVQDSSRLLNRKRGGPSLQEEEKMRKRVTDIPKNIVNLRVIVEEFEKAHLEGEKLVLGDVLGEDQPVMVVVESIEKQHEERVQREREQRMKKHEQNTTTAGGPVKKIATGSATAVKPRVPMKPKN